MSDSPVASSFIEAANYSPGGNDNVTRVVIHDEEYPDNVNAAVEVAHFFANQARSNAGSSAHYCADEKQAVGCVHEADRAWHAPPNAGSIGVEHSGYSHQTAAEWADAYTESMLHVSARLVADICKRHDIPIVWLSAADLLAGKRGITSHNNVSLAWHESSHTDPGPNFPIAHYIDLVLAAAGGTPTPIPEEDDMPYAVTCQPGQRTVVPLPDASKYSQRWIAVIAENDVPGVVGISPGPGKSRQLVKDTIKAGVNGGYQAKADERYVVVVNNGTEPVTAWVEFAAA